MDAPDSPPAVETLTRRMARLWLVDVPGRLHRLLPGLAFSFLDGAWTAARPSVAAFAPLAGFLVGLLAPFAWPGLEVVYTESLVLMALVIAGAILSGPVGVMLWAGYAVGDLLFGTVPTGGSPLWLRQASRLVPLVLLVVPAIVLPTVAQKLIWPMPLRWLTNRSARVGARAILYAATCGLLVFTWAQAMIVLVRPVFGWVRGNPTVEAIFQVQVRWPWLVGVAIAAALVRVLAEHALLRESPRAQAAIEVTRQLRARLRPRTSLWQRVPAPVRVILVTAFMMVVLAGIYERWFDALAVVAVVAPLEAWRNGLVGPRGNRWASVLAGWPLLVRFLALVGVGYLVSYWVAAVLYDTGSFRLVLAGALLTVIATYLLFPSTTREELAA
ncbi:MAG: hypothetical protein ACRD02_04215 [Acidimicrobiia bacterium]